MACDITGVGYNLALLESYIYTVRSNTSIAGVNAGSERACVSIPIINPVIPAIFAAHKGWLMQEYAIR